MVALADVGVLVGCALPMRAAGAAAVFKRIAGPCPSFWMLDGSAHHKAMAEHAEDYGQAVKAMTQAQAQGQIHLDEGVQTLQTRSRQHFCALMYGSLLVCCLYQRH